MSIPMHSRVGWRGEQFTARFLRKLGYDILTVNYVTLGGETDIIARDRDGTICFVEVKTRSSVGMFPPADAVDREKQRRLISNAYCYLGAKKLKRSETRIRFDISEVIIDDIYTAKVNYIKNAFDE